MRYFLFLGSMLMIGMVTTAQYKSETINTVSKLSFLNGDRHGTGWVLFNGTDSLSTTQKINTIDVGTTMQIDMSCRFKSNDTIISTLIKITYDPGKSLHRAGRKRGSNNCRNL